MALANRQRNTMNIWPGFVDALATLLMVIIFLLMIFVVSQFYLNDALEGRDEALDRLNNQVTELADLLNLEREASAKLRNSAAQISAELQSSLAARDDLTAKLNSLLGIQAALKDAETALKKSETERDSALKAQAGLIAELEDASKTIAADKEKIELQVKQLADLQQESEALKALRDELKKQIAEADQKLASAEDKAALQSKKLVEEKEISTEARAQVALLNRQLSALRQQIAQLNQALEASELRDKQQEAQIANLGQRLNTALASKVQELARYRSEFFGRLRQVLGQRRDIQIVGDRFVFQSEVLFASGSAELEESGKSQLSQLADTLKEISRGIPTEINWVMRVDGHTDRIPISTARFPSNWELSTARAVSVVKFLQSEGIPANRLAATGFGENQPLDPRNDEFAFRRNRRIELKFDQR